MNLGVCVVVYAGYVSSFMLKNRLKQMSQLEVNKVSSFTNHIVSEVLSVVQGPVGI